MSNSIVPNSAPNASGTVDESLALERLKAEQQEPTSVGLLVRLAPHETIAQAVRRGLFTWQQSPFHRAFRPTVCQVNPAQATNLPPEIDGLRVILSAIIALGHVRLASEA